MAAPEPASTPARCRAMSLSEHSCSFARVHAGKPDARAFVPCASRSGVAHGAAAFVLGELALDLDSPPAKLEREGLTAARHDGERDVPRSRRAVCGNGPAGC
jgi:hypothetical protein